MGLFRPVETGLVPLDDIGEEQSTQHPIYQAESGEEGTPGGEVLHRVRLEEEGGGFDGGDEGGDEDRKHEEGQENVLGAGIMGNGGIEGAGGGNSGGSPQQYAHEGGPPPVHQLHIIEGEGKGDDEEGQKPEEEGIGDGFAEEEGVEGEGCEAKALEGVVFALNAEGLAEGEHAGEEDAEPHIGGGVGGFGVDVGAQGEGKHEEGSHGEEGEGIEAGLGFPLNEEVLGEDGPNILEEAGFHEAS